jgi:hypothetical protein
MKAMVKHKIKIEEDNLTIILYKVLVHLFIIILSTKCI